MRKGPSRRIGRSGNAMPLICNTRSFDAADVPSQWAQLIRWLFVFNSRFARINQDHRSASASRQRIAPHPEGLTTCLVPVEVDFKQQIFDVCSSLDTVAKVVLQKVSKIPRTAGTLLVQ
jgi:hypothetical protein